MTLRCYVVSLVKTAPVVKRQNSKLGNVNRWRDEQTTDAEINQNNLEELKNKKSFLNTKLVMTM